MGHLLQNEYRATKNDYRIMTLWWVAKVVFGVLVTMGIQNAGNKLEKIDSMLMQEKTDHAALGNLQKQTEQIVSTLKIYGAAIQENTNFRNRAMHNKGGKR